VTKLSDAERFLQAVFREHERYAIFANLNPARHTRNIAELDPHRDCYWSIAAFGPDAKTNLGDDALHTVALVIDDVGTKVPESAVMLALGSPTTIVRTSAGNYQWGYRLTKPVTRADWPGFFAGVEALIRHPLEARGAQTLMRLPMGRNTKPANKGFAVELVTTNPGVEIDPDTIPRAHDKITGAAKTSSGGGWAHDIAGLLALIPNNDLHYDEWFAHAERAMAAAIDKDTVRPAFEAWSAKSVKHDEAEIEKRWWSVNPTVTSGKELLAEAEAADPAGYTAWQKRESEAAFDDGVDPTTAPRQVTFALGANNQILLTMENAARGLWGLWKECRYDAFHHRFYVNGERLTDHMVLLLRVEINSEYGKDFGDKHTLDAITALGLKNKFNPVVDMLAEAEAGWDGVKRLDRLGPDYFHTEDSELARACFRKVMLAAVRRARRPGCKFDQILVLESPEGWDKSTAWEVLAGRENFSDANILGKDARQVQEELADIWIHEIADLSGLVRAEVEAVKAFASRTNDRARPAYGKVLIDQPRQSIEVGTTNSGAYLMSPTGNRRFWPFKLAARVETARLRADRLQLWGEAAAAEAAGETLVLDKKLWAAAEVEQEERRVVDPWEDELANLPDTLIKEVNEFGVMYQTITNVAINDYLGGHRGAALTSAAGRKITEIMAKLKWVKYPIRDALGKKVRGYRRGTDGDTSVLASVPENPF